MNIEKDLSKMQTYDAQQFDEERALYGVRNALITNCTFDGPADGESALKECSDLQVKNCYFNLRYPLWHVNRAVITDSDMTSDCRAALWYDKNITISNTRLHGIKALRECSGISLADCDVNSPEFIWRCNNVKIMNSTIESEYPLFESKNITINRLSLKGKYSFQYVDNMMITNSNLDTKDAFWHTNNVTVIDSVVKGEYLGWYSSNLKFIRCRIIGTQPLCYCRNLVLEDCIMEGTDLSFERSEVNARIRGRVEGIKNPVCGKISADEIKELLFETDIVNPKDTQITCDRILKTITT